jgi:hypothetical protein
MVRLELFLNAHVLSLKKVLFVFTQDFCTKKNNFPELNLFLIFQQILKVKDILHTFCRKTQGPLFM